eukprot:2145427-Alexandrium_andersonii.AAC.1
MQRRSVWRMPAPNTRQVASRVAQFKPKAKSSSSMPTTSHQQSQPGPRVQVPPGAAGVARGCRSDAASTEGEGHEHGEEARVEPAREALQPSRTSGRPRRHLSV